jgi:hypothetical protein
MDINLIITINIYLSIPDKASHFLGIFILTNFLLYSLATCKTPK